MQHINIIISGKLFITDNEEFRDTTKLGIPTKHIILPKNPLFSVLR